MHEEAEAQRGCDLLKVTQLMLGSQDSVLNHLSPKQVFFSLYHQPWYTEEATTSRGVIEPSQGGNNGTGP